MCFHNLLRGKYAHAIWLHWERTSEACAWFPPYFMPCAFFSCQFCFAIVKFHCNSHGWEYGLLSPGSPPNNLICLTWSDLGNCLHSGSEKDMRVLWPWILENCSCFTFVIFSKAKSVCYAGWAWILLGKRLGSESQWWLEQVTWAFSKLHGFFPLVLWIKPRALNMLCKCSAIKLYP
jgi:hypothetical protein